MKPILLFDADGVIVSAKMFSQQLADEYGVSTATTKEFFTTVFPDCIVGKTDLKKVIGPFLKQWGWKKSVDDFWDYWFKSGNEVDSQLIKTIQKIRAHGIPCYVATNQERHRAEYMKNAMQFETLFDDVFSSAQLGCRKPEREFYARIAEKLGVTEKNMVCFFDDTQEHVLGAAEYGFRAWLYTGFQDFSDLASKEGWL